METYFREVFGNKLLLNSPLPPYSWVYNIFVDETYVWHLCTSDQIWLLMFGHFWKFSLICDFYFWQISPPWRYVLKDTSNQFLVQSIAKNSLRIAKNVLLFFILHFGWQVNGGFSTPRPLLAMLLVATFPYPLAFGSLGFNLKSSEQPCIANFQLQAWHQP